MYKLRESTSQAELEFLAASEYFHYATKFRDKLFVLVLEKGVRFDSVLGELRLLRDAGINLAIVLPGSDELFSSCEFWNRAEELFCPIREELFERRFRLLGEKLISENRIPVVALDESIDVFGGSDQHRMEIKRLLEALLKLKPHKVLFLTERECQIEGGRALSYLDQEELSRFACSEVESTIPADFFRLLQSLQDRLSLDVVLLPPRVGCLFQEIFTHRGAGTLISNDFKSGLRRAKATDLAQMIAIMLPYVSKGILKPVEAKDVLAEIETFSVSVANEQVVALGKLTPYGNQMEIGKLCSIPRYRRRGRSASLVRHLLSQAFEQGAQSVFALATEDKTIEFFERLGFTQTARECLPDEWKAGYDFSRSSRALSCSHLEHREIGS